MLQRSIEWTLSDTSKRIVDARASDLTRNAGAHFPPNMEVWQSIHNSTIVRRLASALSWAHLFAGIFPEKVAGPFVRLVQLLQTLHDETSDVSDDAGDQSAREERTRRLTQFAVGTLCRLETCLPEQKFTSMMHLNFNTSSPVHSTVEQRAELLVFPRGCFFMER